MAGQAEGKQVGTTRGVIYYSIIDYIIYSIVMDCVYIYIYIYTCIEREIYVHTYTYIYIYI